jgi:hypothetical protein
MQTIQSARETIPVAAARSAVAPDLEAELGQVVSGEVRFDAGSRAVYATDSSNSRQVPIGGGDPARPRGRRSGDRRLSRPWCARPRPGQRGGVEDHPGQAAIAAC